MYVIIISITNHLLSLESHSCTTIRQIPPLTLINHGHPFYPCQFFLDNIPLIHSFASKPTLLDFKPFKLLTFGVLILFPLTMRRSFRGAAKQEKQFIHTYHINEVPLPYYNPLEDPHLKPFFSNSKVNHHIKQKGLRYEVRREYPYDERRTKNAYRHHRLNSPQTPASHLVKDKGEARGMAKSMFLNRKIESSFFEGEEPVSPVMRRKAESEIFNQKPNKGLFLEEIMKRPNRPPKLNLSMSSASAQYRKKMVHSSDNSARPSWTRKRNISAGRQQILDPQSPN